MPKATFIVLNKVESALLATFPAFISDEVLVDFKQTLLGKLSKEKSQYLLCDLSGLEFVDIDEYLELIQTLSMASLLGTKAIMVGMKANIAATIVDYDIDVAMFEHVLNLDDGLALTRQ